MFPKCLRSANEVFPTYLWLITMTKKVLLYTDKILKFSNELIIHKNWIKFKRKLSISQCLAKMPGFWHGSYVCAVKLIGIISSPFYSLQNLIPRLRFLWTLLTKSTHRNAVNRTSYTRALRLYSWPMITGTARALITWLIIRQWHWNSTQQVS